MKRSSVVLLALAALFAAAPCVHAGPEGKPGAPFSSFSPGELWQDDNGVHINAHGGGVLAHEGVYYWFGEHKIGGEPGNRAQVGVHVYASRDLYNWKDMGIALAVSDQRGSEIEKDCIIERPKVLFNARTRKFVMWFHLELKGQGYKSARAGLAVADRPTGPYTFVRSLRPNPGVWPVNVDADFKSGKTGATQYDGFLRRDVPGGQMSRDMTLFQDDDGTAYLLSSAEENQTLALHELTPDYQNFTGKWARVLPGEHNEAPAVFKKDGTYYLITSDCTGWKPNPARSFAAKSIWGPWKKLGNPCRGTEAQNKTTFESQSTFVLPAPGRPGEFIFLGDRWRPKNAIDGRYVWLPIEWENGSPILRWHASWDLGVFKR